MIPSVERDNDEILWNSLAHAPSASSIARIFGDGALLPTFPDYVRELCERLGEKPASVLRRVGVERTFGFQLLRGVRKPSRDMVIRFAFALNADVPTAQKLLACAERAALTPLQKRDAVILYGLIHGLPVLTVQTTLMELNVPILGAKTER